MKYTELREQKRIKLSDSVPLASPFTIYVEPTNICNFKCHYCPESFDYFEEKSGGFFKMDLNSFSIVTDQIKTMGKLKVLNFYMMGEPFANPSLVEFIHIAVKKEVADRICVTSNGTLISEKVAEKILNSDLDYLRISIYGAYEETHKSRTQSNFKLSKTKQNIEYLKKRRDELGKTKPHIYIKMIETSNPDENKYFLDTFAVMGDEIVLKPVMNWNDPEGENLSLGNLNQLVETPNFQYKKKVWSLPFYIWGCGGDFKNYVLPFKNELSIEGIIDSNPALHGQSFEKLKIAPFNKEKHANTKILVSSLRYGDEIKLQMLSLGVKEDNIVLINEVLAWEL